MALMSAAERATQIWAVLAFAARNRQILTYGLLARLVGIPAVGLAKSLEPSRPIASRSACRRSRSWWYRSRLVFPAQALGEQRPRPCRGRSCACLSTIGLSMARRSPQSSRKRSSVEVDEAILVGVATL
jgi:hypothetical protein